MSTYMEKGKLDSAHDFMYAMYVMYAPRPPKTYSRTLAQNTNSLKKQVLIINTYQEPRPRITVFVALKTKPKKMQLHISTYMVTRLRT